MGRRKISIKQIEDTKLRNITFNKRKNGLIKKAAELSMLCNVNMLLIFEDGYGNLIQFSRDKIKNIAAFFKDCKYNNVIEVSSKDYPDFPAVSQFRKLRDRSDASLVVKKHGTRTRKIPGQEQEIEESEFELEETSTDDITSKTDSSSSQPTPKNMVFTPTSTSLADKLLNQSAQNKGKNKLGLKLRIPEEKQSNEQETAKNNAIAQQASKVVFDESENNYDKPAMSPGQFQPAVYPESSPYGLFEVGRLSGNTIPSGDSLAARPQGFSYTFPQNGNLNMNLQANCIGDYEEKLDSAKMNAFLNCGQINDQQCFNFEERNCQDDIIGMNNQFSLTNVEVPMLRNGMSVESQASNNNFYDMNFGNFMNEPGDFRNFMVAPMKKMKQI
jgi:hypothetical protein